MHIHAELIQKCRQGDREAHYQLYKLYSRSMYNVGYRIVNNQEEAEDVLQEAFISAFRSLDHYRGDATFGSWLKRIVVNKAINTLKAFVLFSTLFSECRPRSIPTITARMMISPAEQIANDMLDIRFRDNE